MRIRYRSIGLFVAFAILSQAWAPAALGAPGEDDRLWQIHIRGEVLKLLFAIKAAAFDLDHAGWGQREARGHLKEAVKQAQTMFDAMDKLPAELEVVKKLLPETRKSLDRAWWAAGRAGEPFETSLQGGFTQYGELTEWLKKPWMDHGPGGKLSAK